MLCSSIADAQCGNFQHESTLHPANVSAQCSQEILVIVLVVS